MAEKRLPERSAAPGRNILLEHVRVFIAEDEPFIALDLTCAVEEAGGKVIGPAGTIAEAFSLLRGARPDVGLLDCNLSDGEITPVAELLKRWSIPLIFYSGNVPQHFRFRDAPIYAKPKQPAELVKALAATLQLSR
jgi:DNA-binding response OmpR family regulator